MRHIKWSLVWRSKILIGAKQRRPDRLYVKVWTMSEEITNEKMKSLTGGRSNDAVGKSHKKLELPDLRNYE